MAQPGRWWAAGGAYLGDQGMIKSILVLAGGSAHMVGTLETAARAARRTGAELEVLHVRADAEQLTYYAGDMIAPVPISDRAVEEAEAAISERAQHAKECYAKVFGDQSGGVTWVEARGREPQMLAEYGRTADLVVISRPGSAVDDDDPESVNAALFETGRPVLVAPPTPLASFGTRVAIAWNGSVQAARAIGAAVPLIEQAAEVTVLTAGKADDRPPTDRLVAYLKRHGVSAKIDSFDPGSLSARARGRTLLQHAAEMQADLLVMGAYGQGRVMQFLGLGGATAKVITANTMPLLMAH
jgi:nucleotide-binding universal stress UspA family protein